MGLAWDKGQLRHLGPGCRVRETWGEAEKSRAEPLGAKWLAEILSKVWRLPGEGHGTKGGVVVPVLKSGFRTDIHPGCGNLHCSDLG